MATAEVNVRSEIDQVEHWRAQELIRAGYPAVSSHYHQHRIFHLWVMTRLHQFEWLQEGERVAGEWLAQAHGTRYNLPHEPFVALSLSPCRASASDRLLPL